MPKNGEIPTSLFNEIVMKQIRLQGVPQQDRQAVAAAIKTIESVRYPLEKIMTKDDVRSTSCNGRRDGLFRPINVAIDQRM